MLSKNQTVTIQITGMTAEGSGVGRHEGLAIFVPQTAAGDTAQVKIVKALKSYAYGRLESLMSPSPERIEPDCPVYTQCGGCVFRHINYAEELRVKDGFVRDAFARIGGLKPEFEPILGSEMTAGYRNKAQYPVGLAEGKAVCGFYAQRSHRIIPSQSCALQPVLFADIAADVLSYVTEKGIPVWDESTGKGVLRHIYLRSGAHSGQVQLCLVSASGNKALFSELAVWLGDKHPQIKSVVLNVNRENTNVILGGHCITLYGSGAISDTLCGLDITLSPLSFYQVNTLQAERLYGIVEEYAQLDGGETVLDLYCGIGTIGLSLVSKARQVIGVESVEQAVADARDNAKRNGIVNARFLCADAATAARQLSDEGICPDLVILDPPRKGCERSVLETAAHMTPKRIVMVSCNPATAARDCAILAQMGYAASKARAVDMFPRTGHVETCVLLSHKNPQTSPPSL